eukprot:576254-Rhodomonas_salina.1
MSSTELAYRDLSPYGLLRDVRDRDNVTWGPATVWYAMWGTELRNSAWPRGAELGEHGIELHQAAAAARDHRQEQGRGRAPHPPRAARRAPQVLLLLFALRFCLSLWWWCEGAVSVSGGSAAVSLGITAVYAGIASVYGGGHA